MIPLSSRWRPLFLFALAALLYLPTLSGDFVLDDQTAIRDNPIVHRGDWAEILTTDYWAGFHSDRSGLYRPLTIWSFVLNYRLAGPAPFAYHLVELLLHAAVAALLYLFCQRCTQQPDLAWWAGLLFAAHPVLSEAVAGLVGRADLLAALFTLLALLQHLSARERPWHYLLAGSALLAALLSKESAIAAPALLLLVDLFQYRGFSEKSLYGNSLCRRARAKAPWARRPKEAYLTKDDLPTEGNVPFRDNADHGACSRAQPEWSFRIGSKCYWPAHLFYAAVTLLYLGWRWQVIGGLLISQIDLLDNPLASLPGGLRWANALLVLGRYLGQLTLPAHLSADYSFAALPLAPGWSFPALLGSAAVLMGLGLLLFLAWRSLPWMAFGLGWLLCSLAPTANLLFPIGTGMAERLLYLPAAGFAMAGATALLKLRARPAPACRVALVVFLGCLTLWREGLWRDEYTLFSQAVRAQPRSARAWHVLGKAALRRSEEDLVLHSFGRALEIFPGYYEVYNDLGVFYYDRGEYSRAQDYLDQCLKLRPDYPPAWFNRGLTCYRLGQRERARAAFQQAISFDPRYAQAYYNLGVMELEEGKVEEAVELFRKVLSLDPAHEQARFNLEAIARLTEESPATARTAPGQSP